MEAVLRKEIVLKINDLKAWLREVPTFIEDPELRSTYVALLTTEGAVLLGNTVEFGNLCVEYCRAKEREAIDSN